MVEKEKGKEMLDAHKKQFGEGLLINKRAAVLQHTPQGEQEEFFNYEELFYLNRIAFRLFKNRGFLATFPEFVELVTTL